MDITISNIPQKELAKGIKGRYIHTKTTTIGFVELEKGAVLPSHSHIHEQTTQVISGQLEMTIDSVTKIYNSGQIIIIPSNAVHSANALTDCKLTDTFCPVREDYR